jgi:hypothetical protein
MIRRLNAPVADVARFAELSGKKRPLGMKALSPTYHLLRETYFDTSDGALAKRGMTLRLRAEARGRSVLEFTIAENVSLQGIVQEQVLETPVVGGGLYATLATQSEVATRVRKLVEPDALRPRAAVDIDREVRELRPGFFGTATHRILLDEGIAHAPDATREFQEVTIVEITSGRTTLEELGGRLQREHGVVSDGMDTFRRIRKNLFAREGAPRPEVPNDVRVALLVMRDWEMALVEGVDGFTLPHARGSGEAIASEFLAELMGERSAQGLDLDLVGFTTARRGGADLEVWLHEAVPGDEPDGVVWIPILEVMQRLGGPRLRDPRLVSTLLMLVRSEMGQRVLREAPHRRSAPVVLPLDVRDPELKAGKGTDDFLDLDLSILDFNQRVLELAEDVDLPLLERFRFLSIFSSNMDEFFMVRVGRMKHEVSTGAQGEEEDFSAEQHLDLVSIRVRSLIARQYACLQGDLLPALVDAGTRIVTWDDLSADQREALRRRFTAEVFPLLTPLALSSGPGWSFPRLVSLGLALAVALRRAQEGPTELGYVPVPEDLHRFLEVPESSDLIPIEAVIGANLGELFPGASIERAWAFRATRLGDVDIDEDASRSLLRDVADEVEARAYKPVIRLEVESAMPREARAHILKAIREDQTADGATLTRSDVYDVPGLVDLRAISELCDLPVQGGVFP